MNDVLDDPRFNALPLLAQRVYIDLRRRSDGNHKPCFPSESEIGKRLVRSRQSISKAIGDLKKAGFIEVVGRHMNSNVYEFRFPQRQENATTDPAPEESSVKFSVARSQENATPSVQKTLHNQESYQKSEQQLGGPPSGKESKPKALSDERKRMDDEMIRNPVDHFHDRPGMHATAEYYQACCRRARMSDSLTQDEKYALFDLFRASGQNPLEQLDESCKAIKRAFTESRRGESGMKPFGGNFPAPHLILRWRKQLLHKAAPFARPKPDPSAGAAVEVEIDDELGIVRRVRRQS